jgi:hypothetical protein
VNQITWDIGAEEYLITQEGTGMYSQALLTTGDPVAIALAVGGAFALGSSIQADLFISGDKLYVIHPSGNFVIRWTGSVFVAYTMGLAYPWIIATTSATVGVITGSYTWGIEKVYRVSGVDLMASTPNRKTTASPSILATSGTVSLKRLKMTIRSTELDNDTLWTHLRVWRSKNKDPYIVDPINPIDAQGNDDELYEEALITKAEMALTTLTSVATGSTLPPGNAGTQAGCIATVYTIEVNNADSVLFNLIGIDRIELLPLPAATLGCFCANRIFVSGIQDAALDDASKNNIWYSNYAGTKYAFQYNPLNFIDTGRDGQNMMKLIAFEKDVIGIKESKTGRLPSGNVDLPYQTLDEKIGISHKNLAAFIPAVGLVAITNDYGDFRVFDYSLRWTNMLNGIDVSLPVRSITSAVTAGNVSFAYINGKVIISYAAAVALVLHAQEGRGWTKYGYLTDTLGRIFTFAQNTRAALVIPSTHLVEIEVSGSDGDIQTAIDTQRDLILLTEETHQFQRNRGKDILEHEYLSINAYLPNTLNVPCYGAVNGLSWPAISSNTAFDLTPRSTIAGANLSLADREYRLYIQPSTIGAFKWCPMVGNYLSYTIFAYSPATMRSKELHCTVDENGMGWGAFDPFQVFAATNTDPSWAQ